MKEDMEDLRSEIQELKELIEDKLWTHWAPFSQ